MDYRNMCGLAVLLTTAFIATATSATDWLWQVTTYEGFDYDPSWSPNGTDIAFTSFRSGNPDIWIIPAESGIATRITTDPDFDYAPSWSPDGSTIAFTSSRSGWWDIWTIPAGGGTPT